MIKENLKWYDRKRLWCGLPWTFTKYGMSEDRLFLEEGLLNTKEYEVRLYRVLNISLSRSFVQRIFGLGTIHIDSNDRDLKCFEIKNIRNSVEIKELISETVESERLRNRVNSREYMVNDADDEHAFDDVEDEEDECEE